MAKRLSFTVLPVCVLFALSAAFLFTQPVFAQDETPPQVAPTEAPAEVLPTEASPVEVVPTEVAPTEVGPTEATPVEALSTEVVPSEAVPTEVTPVEEVPTKEAPTEAAPVEEAPAPGPSLAETLADAGVVLADENGVAVSLASQGAQEFINSGDPWFFVGSVLHQFVFSESSCDEGAVCTVSTNPIQAAINAVKIDGLMPLMEGFLLNRMVQDITRILLLMELSD